MVEPGDDAATGRTLDELRRWLDALAELSRAANQGLGGEELLMILAATTCHLTGYPRCAILLADEPMQMLRVEGWYGLSQAYVDGLNERFPLGLAGNEAGQAPSSRAYRTQRPAIVPDFSHDPTLARWKPVFLADVEAMASVPLTVSGSTFGVLNVYLSAPHEFSSGEIVLLETIANQAALALEASRLRSHERQRIHELEALNARLEAQRLMLERAQRVHEALMRALLEERSRDALATVVAATLDCSVVLQGAPGSPQRVSRAGPDADGLAELVGRAEVDARVSASEAAGRLIALAGVDADPSDLLVVPILVAGELAGRLWARRATTFDEFEHRTLERAAVVVAVALQSERSAAEVEWRLSRDFLDELLAYDETSDRAMLIERGLHLGVDLRRPQVVLIVRAGTTRTRPDAAAAELAAANQRIARHLLAAVQRSADEIDLHGITAARNDHVVLLWLAEDPDGLDAAIRRLRADVGAYGPGGCVTIGVSAVCTALDDYDAAYRSVVMAVSLDAGGDRSRVVRVPDLGIYSVLMNVRRPETLVEFSAATLRPLREYDEGNHADLIETLRTYLEQQCHTGRTAEALYVHPNTIAYRLQRIRQLTGVNPSDLGSLLAYELAFKIERLLEEPANG